MLVLSLLLQEIGQFAFCGRSFFGLCRRSVAYGLDQPHAGFVDVFDDRFDFANQETVEEQGRYGDDQSKSSFGQAAEPETKEANAP